MGDIRTTPDHALDDDTAPYCNLVVGERRLPALDGLREFMTIAVVLSHYFGELPHGIPAFTFDWIAVDMFFVLSGYLVGTLSLAALPIVILGGWLLTKVSRSRLTVAASAGALVSCPCRSPLPQATPGRSPGASSARPYRPGPPDQRWPRSCGGRGATMAADHPRARRCA